MMFSRLVVLTTLALPLLAVATPAAVARNDAPTTACCASTVPASSAAGAAALKSIDVTLSDIDVILGLICSPITVVGVGSGNTCSSSPVSCSDGIVGGVGIGCVPVTL